METSKEFARAIKARHSIESDYGLAKLLGISTAAMSLHKTGGVKAFSDETGYRIAELLDLPAEYVLSCLAAERAKDSKVKEVWQRVAELTRVAVWLPAFIAVTLLAGAAVTPSPAEAQFRAMYIMSNVRRYLVRVARATIRCYLVGLGGIARMLRTTTIAAACLLAACGSESGQNNHGYGWQYDQAGVSGLRVRFDGYPTPTFDQIEALYLATQTCTGISATGPLVIFKHETFTGTGSDGVTDLYGLTILDTGTILISSLLDPDPARSAWTYEHEFVHYLLHQSGFPLDQNAAHQSPFFTDCTQ